MRKGLLLVLIVMILVGSVFAAGETGEGEATVSPAYVWTGQTLTNISLTFTAKTTNIVNGVIAFKVPDENYLNPLTDTITTAGTGTEIGPVQYWGVSGSWYVKVTLTADIDQTVAFHWNPNYTIASAAALTWNFYEAADDNANTSGAISSQPVMTSVSSNKAVTVASQGPGTYPTPLVIQDNALAAVFTWVLNLEKHYKAGQVSIQKPDSSWADFSANTYAAGYIAVSGVGGTPTITSNLVTVPVAVATAGQDITVKYGGGDPSVLNKKTTYALPAIFPVRGNAISSVATETPIATSIIYNVTVATPTIVISATGYDKDGTNIRVGAVPWSYLTLLKSSTPVADLGIFQRDYKVKGIGGGSYSVKMTWKDYNNGGGTATNTSNSLTITNFGNYSEDLIGLMANAGLLKTATIGGDNTNDIPYQMVVSDTADAIVLEVKAILDELAQIDVLADTGTATTWKDITTLNRFKLVSPNNPLYVPANSYLAITAPVAAAAINTYTVKYILKDDFLKVVK